MATFMHGFMRKCHGSTFARPAVMICQGFSKHAFREVPFGRVFLNPWFGEPVVRTPVVFVIFVVAVISANPALNSLLVAV